MFPDPADGGRPPYELYCHARSTGGFGLGLSICKALVDAYNGTIEAINLPGQGTQMRVQLPAESN